MTFRQFVYKNVVRNKRLYAAYFLSSMFTVMVFFTFAIFAFHPAFSEGNMNEQVLYGMGVAGGIIYLFSFFFVLYSMGSFLQSRKKEFGLLMLHGMSMRQIRFMVFLENMLIGVFATLIGIGIGVLFAKLILMIAENVLIIEEVLHFYVPIWPILITFLSFVTLFLVISFFVTFILRSKKLASLIKANQQPKKEPKASIILTVIAIMLLAVGYVTALLAKGMVVLAVMVPVIIVVMIGTYFFFTQLSVYIIHFLQKRKSVFWKKTNMILLSDLSFRMKDNARTFFMVAMISTVAFSAIGTLFGFQSYLTGEMKEANPYSFTYNANESQTPEEIEQDIALVNERLEEKDFAVEQVTTEFRYYDTTDRNHVLIVSESMYNELAELLGKKSMQLQADEVIGIEQRFAMIEAHGDEMVAGETVQLKTGEVLQVTDVMESNVLLEMFAHYVVTDEMYAQLPSPANKEFYTVWQADGDMDKIIQAGEEISDIFVERSYRFQANDYILYTINKFYGPVLFIGLFIGIVFFVSAGSFLYFRLYSDLDDDKAKFSSIARIGLTEREMKKVITRQTAILFFAPIIVALIHGAVALTALSHMFDYSLVKESAIVLSSFLIIQLFYYFIVRYLYTKQVKTVL